MDEFAAIRPYNDDEVAPVLARLITDPTLLSMMTRYFFPRMAGPFGWALKPFISRQLRNEVNGINCVDQLQNKVGGYVERTIAKATDGVEFSGLERLDSNLSHVFMANHRDIVMDPAFVNFALHHAGHRVPRIAIGDNLLQRPFVSDLMRLNKSFIVPRSVTGRREKLAAYLQLSAYINHSIRNDHESIWIAQAEGRAKDGNDRTDSAILKMLHMSRKDETFQQVISDLHIVPVSISYEYDPCDLAKARELYTRATTGSYTKAPGEDDASIALGITGYKGRVHIAFGEACLQVEEDPKQLAARLDQAILGNYRLFPVHYLAYHQWAEKEPELNVPSAESVFDESELNAAKAKWQARLEQCPDEHKPYLVQQYAQPVLNQYRVKQGIALD